MVNFLIVSQRLRPVVELVDVALDHRAAHASEATTSAYALPRHAVWRGPAGDRVGVEGDERRGVVAAGAVDDELAGVGAQALERRLDDRRRDVLAAGVLNRSFLRSVMRRKPRSSTLADVAGVEPAVLASSTSAVASGVVVVAAHDAGALDAGSRRRSAMLTSVPGSGQPTVPSW